MPKHTYKEKKVKTYIQINANIYSAFNFLVKSRHICLVCIFHRSLASVMD